MEMIVLMPWCTCMLLLHFTQHRRAGQQQTAETVTFLTSFNNRYIWQIVAIWICRHDFLFSLHIIMYISGWRDRSKPCAGLHIPHWDFYHLAWSARATAKFFNILEQQYTYAFFGHEMFWEIEKLPLSRYAPVTCPHV